MIVIGLTGGVGTGKSTVSRILREKGYKVIDADEIARTVVEPGRRAYQRIRAEFGEEFFDDENGGIMRRDKIGQLVFADEEKRRKLNAITHPEILKEIVWQVVCSALHLNKYIFLDIPLLFETKLDRFMLKTIVVTCNEETQFWRVVLRDEVPDDEARKKIGAQMPMSEKVKRANYVIDNNSSLEDTEKQVQRIVKSLESSWIPFIIRSAIITIISVIFIRCLV